MAIARYETQCDTPCLGEQQPAIAAVKPSVTSCPTSCSTANSAAIPKPLTPDGTPMTVDYFWQVLDIGDTPAPIDHYMNPAFQRLAWFKDVKIFVTQPLTVAVDPVSNIMTREGVGTVVGFAPNDGDAFIVALEADIRYLFRVIEATPTSAYGNNSYRIEYQAFDSVQDLPVLLTDLASKVASYDIYTFDLASYLNGSSSPFLTTADIEASAVKQTQYTALVRDWEQFYDRDSATYVATIPEGRLYDPFVNEAMLKLMGRVNSTCPRKLNYLYSREVSYYSKTCISTPYNATSPYSTLKRYPRISVLASYGVDSIRHTSIEWIVLDGSGLPADIGQPLSEISSLHTDGYLVSNLFGTTDPGRSAIDVLLEGIQAKLVTPAMRDAVFTQYQSAPAVDKYWLIPLLLMSLEV